MTKKIDHVAIAVGNLAEAIGLFEKILGLPVTRLETVAGYDVETATFELGETAIELIEGIGEESPISKYVGKRGPGIHHVAFAVDDLEKALTDLKSKGFRLVDETPRPGKDGSRVAFIHPESTGKVLCELVEPADENS